MIRRLIILLLIVGCAHQTSKRPPLTEEEFNELRAKLEDGTVKFIPYDKQPKPKIPIRPVYPETAQEKGIEGTVYIQIFIDSKGNVTEAEVMKGIPELNEAALAAVKKSKWKPAQQRDKKVGVWQMMPITFNLSGYDSLRSPKMSRPEYILFILFLFYIL